MTIVYLFVITIKAIASIEPRQYQKTELNWKKYEPKEETHTRPVTKKEFAEAGWVSDYIEGKKVYCRTENDSIVWCDYWGTPPNN
jgi:hypothetical protein